MQAVAKGMKNLKPIRIRFPAIGRLSSIAKHSLEGIPGRVQVAEGQSVISVAPIRIPLMSRSANRRSALVREPER